MLDNLAQLVERRKTRITRKLFAFLHWGLIDLDFRTLVRRILQLEVVAFAGIILASWINELYDLPSLAYGAPPTPVNLWECWIETGWALLVLCLVLAITQIFLKQIRHLEGFFPVCSFCKSIRVEEDWMPLEEFMQVRTRVRMTHSLCPDCAERHYGYIEDEDLKTEA